MRTPKEFAREMVPEPCKKDGRGQILAELRDPGSTSGTVWPIFAWPGEVDDLRAFIARTITQARADGAAAALAGQQPRDLAGRISELGERWLRIWLSLGQFDLDGDDVLRVCLELIREAHWSARGVGGVRPVAEIARTARHGATVAVDLRREMYLRLADELDAIVRDDCGAVMTDRERDLDAAVSAALSYLHSALRYRDAAGITVSPPQCERDLWEHIQRAVDALRRVERT